ncbi:MAG: hypothetical protein L0207_01460 [Chlamydiae bacterium]|nr:hypothetical protein [Chlamydiota bacterium]
MTTAAISSKPFQMPLVEEIRDFLDKLKKSKIFALKNLCNGSLREKRDLQGHTVSQRKNSRLTKIWRRKDNWDDLEKEIDTKVLSHLIPLHPENPFSGTDLLVFRDEYPATLPLNGIRHSEFLEVKELLTQIFSEKTRFKFDPALSKKSLRMLIKDFIILMTRKTSRKLIKEIANGSRDVVIEEGKGFKARHISKDGKLCGHKISICSDWLLLSHMGRAAQLNRYGYKIPAPTFMGLIHELIHVSHYEEDYDYANALRENEDQKSYTNQEERRTISGWEKDEDIVLKDEIKSKRWPAIAQDKYFPVCEWTIGPEFGLPVREDHYGGGILAPGDFSRKNYRSMLKECRLVGAEIDIEKIKRAINL